MSVQAAASRVGAVVAVGLILVAPAAARPQGRALQEPPPLGRSLQVATTLTPTHTHFGDLLSAIVTVGFDPGTVSAASVHVEASFDPYVELGPPATTLSGSGSHETESVRYTIQCTTDGCLPVRHPLRLRLVPVVVTAAAGGHALRAGAAWPVLEIVGRVSEAQLGAASVPFRWPARLPPALYPLRPAELVALLAALASIAALGVLLLVRGAVGSWRARARLRPQTALGALEAALLATRQAAARSDPADRRKALNALAGALVTVGRTGLASDAVDAAWGERPPTPEQARAIADEVEASLGAGAT
jgi:hypothetical protein